MDTLLGNARPVPRVFPVMSALLSHRALAWASSALNSCTASSRRFAVVVRQTMRVTMSCDHRVIDGATGAQFLQTLKQILENPLYLFLSE